jgi:hypothetical protein
VLLVLLFFLLVGADRPWLLRFPLLIPFLLHMSAAAGVKPDTVGWNVQCLAVVRGWPYVWTFSSVTTFTVVRERVVGGYCSARWRQ